MLCLCNSEGNRARSYFSQSLPLSSQGDESQMSGYADETVGNNRQEGLMAASPPIPRAQSNIQMGSFLRVEQRGFPDDAGQKLGVAGSSRKGGSIWGPQTKPLHSFPGVSF